MSIEEKYKTGLPTRIACPRCWTDMLDRYPMGVVIEDGRFVDYYGRSQFFCPACRLIAVEGTNLWLSLRQTMLSDQDHNPQPRRATK